MLSSAQAASSAAQNGGVIDHLLVWVGVGPGTAHDVSVFVTQPLVAIAVLFVAWLLAHLERRLSLRLVQSMRLVSPLVRSSPRGDARARTLAGVVSAIFRVVIWVTAVLIVLSQLSVHLTPFLFSATVVGAALGFGAQTLVKDFLSGMLLLAEDQYGVGDTLELNGMVATVEAVTLRVTRLRALDGTVWYVPNGDIRTLGNHSEGSSQAVIDLQVPAGTDLAQAGLVAEEEGRLMSEDPQWAAELVSVPIFAGAQDEDASTVTLRLLAQTPPGHHFRVARELRLRVLQRFVKERIAWASVAGTGPEVAPSARDGAQEQGEGAGTAQVGVRGQAHPDDAAGPQPDGGGRGAEAAKGT